MLNVNRLKGRIAEKGYSQSSLAKAIGMTTNTLSSRMCLHTTFNIDEVDKICDVLGITEVTDKVDIFLHNSSHNRDGLRQIRKRGKRIG